MYRRIWLVVVPLATLSLSGGTAIGRGGTKVGAPEGWDVVITTNGNNFQASGALGTARSEPTSGFTPQNKWIGCWVDIAGGVASLTCEATTDIPNPMNQPDLRCVSLDPAMIAALGAMNSDSAITFETPTTSSGGDNECILLRIENVSKYNAKAQL